MSKITIFSKKNFTKILFFARSDKTFQGNRKYRKKNFRLIPDLTLGSKWGIRDRKENVLFF